MTITSLHLSNYKQYRHLDLEFRDGLVGIIGKNGAGKSTLFEAILYCLFGRDESNKALVRSASASPKETVALELAFSMGVAQYRVRREFRGKSLTVGAELYKNEALVAKGVSPVNDELAKVLNMERDAFKRSVFSGQKELSELSDTTGEARKRMVRRMLGLDTLDEVQARANADLRDLSSQAAGQRQNLLSDEEVGQLKKEMAERTGTLQNARAACEKQAIALEALRAQLSAEKDRFQKEEARLREHNLAANALAGAKEQLAERFRQKSQLNQKLSELKKLQETLESQKSGWAAFESKQKAFAQLDAAHARHINRQARLAKIEEAQALLRESTAKMADLRQKLAEKPACDRAAEEKKKEIGELEAQIEAKRSELRVVDSEIGGVREALRERSEKLAALRQLGSQGRCPTCLQPLLEGYERAVSTLEGELNTYQADKLRQLEAQKEQVVQAGKSLRERQNAARAEAEALLKAQARLAEAERLLEAEEKQRRAIEERIAADEAILRGIGAVDFDEAAHARLKAELTEKEGAYREYLAQASYLQKELPAAQHLLKATEESISSTQRALEQHEEALRQIGYDEAAYQMAKQALAAQSERSQAQSDALLAAEKAAMEIEAEQQKAASLLSAHERVLAQISDKLEEVELLRKLAELLGLFKTEILEKVSPGISHEASDLFNRITKGKYEGIRVDENFDFSIADGGIYYPIERFSGGEVDLANFCLRIAITKAIMDLSGASADSRMEFLAFDEIFGSQDEERRLEMMLALHYLQEQFRQIYIVSHIESLKDFFPNLLEVQLGAEGSTAVWR